MKNSGVKRVGKVLCFIVLTVILASSVLYLIADPGLIGEEFHRAVIEMLRVRRDKNGRKPRDIAKAFIEAARAGDDENAA